MSTDTSRDALLGAFADDPRVTLPSATRGKFGANGLRVDGKVFAMWVDGALAVKLPPRDVDAAIAAQTGERLVMGARTMKAWLVVRDHDGAIDLARRAYAFVAAER